MGSFREASMHAASTGGISILGTLQTQKHTHHPKSHTKHHTQHTCHTLRKCACTALVGLVSCGCMSECWGRGTRSQDDLNRRTIRRMNPDDVQTRIQGLSNTENDANTLAKILAHNPNAASDSALDWIMKNPTQVETLLRRAERKKSWGKTNNQKHLRRVLAGRIVKRQQKTQGFWSAEAISAFSPVVKFVAGGPKSLRGKNDRHELYKAVAKSSHPSSSRTTNVNVRKRVSTTIN